MIFFFNALELLERDICCKRLNQRSSSRNLAEIGNQSKADFLAGDNATDFGAVAGPSAIG